MSEHSPALMVFTDLDGTLLDHHSYDWSAAIPALNALKSMGAALILASSKTSAEIAVLRRSLQMQHWPSIVENGAGLLPANSSEAHDDSRYQSLRTALEALPQSDRQCFVGFGDMSDADVAGITGLERSDAALARKRAYSEPGLWKGSDAQKKHFLNVLKKHGISAQQGGRFLTLSFGANKADRLRELRERYKPGRTIALGDAPNDIDMLEAADIGVIVSNPQSTPLPKLGGEDSGRILRTNEPGPQGWNATILELLN